MSTGWLIVAAATVAIGVWLAYSPGWLPKRHPEPEHVGATLDGPTPGAEVRQHRKMTDEDFRRERVLGDEERLLAEATASLAPLFAAAGAELDAALTHFRTTLAATFERWHGPGEVGHCRTCTAVHHVSFTPTRGQLAEALLTS